MLQVKKKLKVYCFKTFKTNPIFTTKKYTFNTKNIFKSNR